MNKIGLNPRHHAEIAQILASVHPIGLRPKEVHERYGFLARSTVIRVLCELVDDGRAKFIGEPSRRLYFAKGKL